MNNVWNRTANNPHYPGGRLVVMRGTLRTLLIIALLHTTAALAAGSVVWSAQWGSPAWEAAFGAIADAVAGWTAGSLFGPANGVDAFLVSLQEGKTQGWQSGWPGLERAYAIAPAPSGYYLGGTVGAPAKDAMRAQTDALLVRLDGAGKQLWRARVGGPLKDQGRALAPAPEGGVYLAGFGDGRIFSAGSGGSDVFVARFSASGSRLWGVQWGSDNNDFLTTAAPDGAGGVYLAGFSDVDEDCRRVSERGFVLRYSAAGELLWEYRWGYDAATRPTALAAAPGGVWVLGQTDGSLYGPFNGGRDVFAVFLSATGKPTVAAQWGSTAADLPQAAVYSGGRLYVAGATAGRLFADCAGGYDAFAAALDPRTGRPQSGWQAGSPSRDQAQALALTPAGELLLAGVTYGDFYGRNAGQADAWAVRLRLP